MKRVLFTIFEMFSYSFVLSPSYLTKVYTHQVSLTKYSCVKIFKKKQQKKLTRSMCCCCLIYGYQKLTPSLNEFKNIGNQFCLPCAHEHTHRRLQTAR